MWHLNEQEWDCQDISRADKLYCQMQISSFHGTRISEEFGFNSSIESEQQMSPCNCVCVFLQEPFQGNIPQHSNHVSFKCSVWRCFYLFFRRWNDLSPPKKFYPEIIKPATLQISPSACMGTQSMNCSELHKQDLNNLACFTWVPSLSCGDKSSTLRWQLNKLR